MSALRVKSLVKSNLQYWMNDLFLRAGLYSNVVVSEIDYYRNNISLLLTQSDPSFNGTNRVFQSAFKNWIYESGIPSSTGGVAPPSIASGVTVDGVFYPEATTSGTYEHFIDFPNGRIVFSTSLIGSPVVEAAFSYATATIDFANVFNNETRPLLIETAWKDNPMATGIDAYPSVDARTLPAVFIDVLSRTSKGYELGDKSLMADLFGVFHVWSHDDMDRDIIEDILTDAQHDVILGINFNTAPYPLLSFGRRNPAWTSYTAMAQLWTPHFWKRIYMESVDSSKDSPLFEVERTRVDFRTRVYPNF